jgi:hypothetical protein
MAEQEGILRFIRGLFKDTSPIDQPMGTYRYAKNLILSDTTGALSNEPGTKAIANLPNNSIVIGTIAITNNKIVLFIKYGPISEVGVYDGNTYEPVLSLPPFSNTDSDLKFNEKYPISGTFKEQADGDLIVYWTDDFNPPRSLNITRQQRSNPSLLYGIAPNSSPDTKLINLLNLFPHAGPVPHVELSDVYSGGGVKTGVYYLALAYSDEDLTESSYVTIANPVPIVEDPEGVGPIESYDGAPPDILTGKSITWNISNINTDMKYVIPQVLAKINGSISVVKLPEIEILNRQSFKVTYSGQETQQTSSLDEVTIDSPEYTKAKTIEQLDSVLYLGNLESDVDVGYQPYANFIKSKACTVEFNPFDRMLLTDDFLSRKKGNYNDTTKGYRDPYNVFNYKGYTREEVYAFYIAFVLKSGRMSYAYHIPGRKPLTDIDPNSVNELMGDSNPSVVNEGNSLYANGDGTVGDWGIIGLTGTENPSGDLDPQGHLFHFYDFSHLVSEGSRGMNYWHNLHEFYPSTNDFRTIDASNPGFYVANEDNRGLNIRHHRFPSNRNAEFTTVKGSNAYEQFSNISTTKKAVVHYFYFGGMDTEQSNGSGFLEGIYPNDDYEAARNWQNDMAPEQRMGGARRYHNNPDYGIGNHEDDPSVDPFKRGEDSCYPPNNSYLNQIGGFMLRELGCSDAVEVDFVYDTNIPPTVEIGIKWDYPWLEDHTEDLEYDKNHCWGTAFATVTSVNNQTVTYGNVRGDFPKKIWNKRGGFACWVECESVISNDEDQGSIDHYVQALGICFEDIKIPQHIADKVQGFRIYYAKRNHENRTVLGQCPLHPMGERASIDPSGCDGGGENVGLIDYWLPGGVPNVTYPQFLSRTFSFMDFYLLNRTPSLASATHLKMQYVLCMASFRGHTEYNVDGITTTTDVEDEPDVYSCYKPEVVTSFHAAGEYFRVQGTTNRLNYILEDKAKAYVLGNTIYEGSSQGFENPIYNIGGHTHIALRTGRFLPYLPSGQQANWRVPRSDGSGASFTNYTRGYGTPGSLIPGTQGGDSESVGLQLHMANLKAFKSDVYNSVDTQSLVWTGFEVLGEKINEFVVDENGNKIIGKNPNFSTEKIFGGDTFISRYGYRMSHREQVNKVSASLYNNQWYNNIASIDNKSVIYVITECTDNINYRHIEDDKVPYYPGDSLKAVLKVKADVDLSYNPDPTTGNMKYNEDYSAVNDLKFVVPLPHVFEQQESHPVRVIRSNTASSSLLIDNYRRYVAGESRDLNNRYGELWKITGMSNVLLFHMEDALYQTKGKQQMKVSEGGDAYVGQGDIFGQLPDLVRHVDTGYIGTRSQFAGLSTPSGYFFVDNIDRKVFLMVGNAVEELSSVKYGMSNWLQKNIPYELENYGFHGKIDSFITGMGFLAVWDDMFKRILLTKRDLRPTAQFELNWKGIFRDERNLLLHGASAIGYINGTYYEVVQEGGLLTTSPLEIDINTRLTGSERPLFERVGWTISFSFIQIQQGKIGSWESFHDYVPYMYSYAGIDVHSFNDSSNSIWKHNDYENISKFYGEQYPFEVEVISNPAPTKDKVFVALNLLSEVKDRVNGDFLINDLNAGFTQYLTYGNDSSSGLRNIEYLINTRKIGSEWRINQFRDMSLEVTDTSQYYVGPPGGFSGTNYLNPGQTVLGGINPGTITSIPQSIFNVDGMNETVNTLFTDVNKPWYLQRKFIGKYLGIRLVSDNTENKLINLYSVIADSRPYER